jgi:transcriptional regulator with PAS, ATPase and Fis domain
MGLLRRELLASLGMETARRLLSRFGYADGYHDAVSLRDHFGWHEPLGAFRASLALLRVEGIVRADPGQLAFDAAAGTFEAVLTWRNSYEAEQHVLQQGPAERPVCWTLAGYVSGFASACAGTDVYFHETACVARGDKRCVLIGRHATGWHEALPEVYETFRGADLRGEVERLRASVQQQRRLLERQLRELRRHDRRRDTTRERAARLADARDFVARSPGMYDALELALRVAPLDSTVLISGESGTGKEFVARLIHDQSPRGRGPLVAVNCGALTETLLESELFGHVRGAFTGAVSDKAGLFEQASGGTLFLDEVGEMTPALQVKLLRALQEREIRRVGGDRTIRVNARVVAATNRDLAVAVHEQRFRQDLYFRIAGLEIRVPPLRERREEVPVMVMTILRTTAARLRKRVTRVSPEAMRRLSAYAWPGNVRELEHVIERAVIIAADSTLRARDLPPHIRRLPEPQSGGDLNLRAHECRLIREAMARFNGQRRRAAEALGISPVSLWRKLKAMDRITA